MSDFPTNLSSNGSLFLLTNNVATTLNGGISAGATSATVTSTNAFPPTGYFTVETEAIKYTSNNTATSVFSGLTRGSDSTTAIAHADGTAVYHNYVANHHNVIKDEIIAIQTNISTRFGLSTIQCLALDSSISLPFYSYAGDPDTGTLRIGADDIGIVTGGTLRWNINSGGNLVGNNSAVVQTSLGTAGLPGYGFRDDPDSGVYNIAANTVGISTAGVARLQISGSLNTSFSDFAISASSKIYVDGGGDTFIDESSANVFRMRAGGVDVFKGDDNSTANETRFQIFDITAAIYQRISIGIANTGGVGFRVLRIPN